MNLDRRGFLGQVGRGAIAVTVGGTVAGELDLAPAAADGADRLHFGEHERLASLMQETEPDRLLPLLVQEYRAGADPRQIVAAAALANARTFGGEDYVGFHTIMALSPAYQMSRELSGDRALLPVLKVAYRNTARIREFGGVKAEVLRPVPPVNDKTGGSALREAVRQRDIRAAEALLAGATSRSPQAAFDLLLPAVHDDTEVHRVVLPYRAWDLLSIVGREHAATMLRQSVRYCVKAESYNRSTRFGDPREVLPRLMEQHRLLACEPGRRVAEDAWVDGLSQELFRLAPADAAAAAAAALAEGYRPDDVGEAISLAANQLVLRDYGRSPGEEWEGKPIGSVHGDSIGVHASDSANAWRNMARCAEPRNAFACLILGAYQVALDRVQRGGDFLNWKPLPWSNHSSRITQTDPPGLAAELDRAVRGNLQARAAAVVHRAGELGHPPRPIFDLLLRYAVSEDGALHAEKYYRTVCEEFAATRPAFRWRHVVGLARVTASEFGRPADGYAEACALLGA